MTNEKMYGEAPYREFGEQTDPVLGERPAFGETGLLALYGMETDIRTYSPLALAFLGDAVYSLIIRTTVVARGNRQAEKLHNETTRLVRAQKQAAVGRAIYDLLTTEEHPVIFDDAAAAVIPEEIPYFMEFSKMFINFVLNEE